MNNKRRGYSIYALLWMNEDSKALMHDFFNTQGVPSRAIQKNLHLTVYHGRRPLPGLMPDSMKVDISVDVVSTRFMVMAPGGENPRPELNLRRKSVGIRLQKKNRAICQIQELRKSIYRLETPEVIGHRMPTTAWRNCFGARHYQPHVKLLHPGNKIERDLIPLGNAFRSGIEEIRFDRFEIRSGVVKS